MNARRDDRAHFFGGFPEFWPDDANGREYALDACLPISRAAAAAMRRCADDVALVARRVAPLLRALDDGALEDLGLPRATHAIARERSPLPELTIARVDMIAEGDGFRAIELNADTPGFVVETHEIAGALCARHGFADPNAGCRETLARALRRAARDAARSLERPAPRPYVVFTAFAPYREDRETMAFQRAALAADDAFDTAFVPLADLGIDRAGLYDGERRTIDVLVRQWPLEFFARDRDEATGANGGAMLFDLVRRRELALVNPPSGYLLQSKGVMALVWSLYERDAFFTPDERDAVARSFLPTWLDEPAAPPYVVKPLLGREGSTVRVVRTDGIEESKDRFFAGEPAVYQAYLPTPRVAVVTERGREELAAVHTCFVVENRATAIGVRLGEGIVDAEARFVALGLEPGGA